MANAEVAEISRVTSPVVVRPRRDFSRAALVRVQPRRYYDEGGIEVHGDRVVVKRTLAGKDRVIERRRSKLSSARLLGTDRATGVSSSSARVAQS